VNLAYTVPQAYRELLDQAAAFFRQTDQMTRWLVNFENVKTRELIESPTADVTLEDAEPDAEEEF
jgi:hypothetical protein